MASLTSLLSIFPRASRVSRAAKKPQMCSSTAHSALDAPASLAQLMRGQRAIIVGTQASGALGDHLLEMGMTRGTHIQVRHRGGLGGRMEIAIRSFVFSLPLEQARFVHVSALP